MILYHGSNQEIGRVELAKEQKFKDFGQGFYTTDIREQAEAWARKITSRFGGKATVTEFEFDLDAALKTGLDIKIFEQADKEWALFVMDNRRQSGTVFKHGYDIVIGPVADDKMVRLFGLYDMDVINLDAVVAGLEYKGLNSQYFFATERALNYLRKI